jgi:CubicO group peptidase (beta-lactamase class C family)
MNFKSSAIEHIFKKNVRKASPGAVLAVIHQGQAIYKMARGLANIEIPTELSTQSVFNTGSLGKQFTAYSILLLEQRKKLDLDDEVRKFIPELANYGRPLKLRHLLWHCSGLRCYTTMLWWAGVAQRDNYSRKQALELLCRQKELNFLPGDEYLYSNSNYLLLSEIVERLSGESISDFCQKEIFKPYGMLSTHFRDKPSLPIKNLATGHFGYDPEHMLVNRNLGALPGVGRLMTNLDDLLRWERFFLKPAPRERPILRSMLTQGWLENGQKIRYGGGLMMQRYRGLAMLRHDGHSSGCRAEFCRFPEKNLSVICLSNNAEINPTWIVRQVANSLWTKELDPVSALGPGQAPSPPTQLHLSHKILREREGLYRAQNEGAFLELSMEDGGLHAQGQFLSLDFLPESATSFQGQAASAIYRMDFLEEGGFILTKQGRALRFEAVKVLEKTAEIKLERFVGRYASPELLSRLDVKFRDGRLWMSDPVGFEWELRQMKGNHFYNCFREISFTKKGMLIEASDHWVRRLKWVRL